MVHSSTDEIKLQYLIRVKTINRVLSEHFYRVYFQLITFDITLQIIHIWRLFSNTLNYCIRADHNFHFICDVVALRNLRKSPGRTDSPRHKSKNIYIQKRPWESLITVIIFPQTAQLHDERLKKNSSIYLTPSSIFPSKLRRKWISS